MPSLPSVVIKLRQYLNDPDVNFDALAKVIEYDPGLTANVLQLANSAYFGWTRTIKHRQGRHHPPGHQPHLPDGALHVGGAAGAQADQGLRPGLRAPCGSIRIATAICAELLAAKLGLHDVEEAFTAGLLHDMGKIVLGTFVEMDDEPIKEIMENDKLAFNEAEQMVLGIDHAEVAGEPAAGLEPARRRGGGRPLASCAQPVQSTDFQVLVDLVHCGGRDLPRTSAGGGASTACSTGWTRRPADRLGLASGDRRGR